MSTLQEKLDRIAEIEQAQQELAEEELRLRQEVANETCPLKEGDRFADTRGAGVVWEVVCVSPDAMTMWYILARDVERKELPRHFHPSDLRNLKPLEATT